MVLSILHATHSGVTLFLIDTSFCSILWDKSELWTVYSFGPVFLRWVVVDSPFRKSLWLKITSLYILIIRCESWEEREEVSLLSQELDRWVVHCQHERTFRSIRFSGIYLFVAWRVDSLRQAPTCQRKILRVLWLTVR